jgi:DNA polymerase III epsilon subunit-like protein
MEPKHVKIYVDTETTGTDPKKNGIIQWTAIALVNGVIKGRINLKIQPFKDDVIEDTALEVNGLTREELFTPDRLTPQQAHKKITDWLGQFISKFDKLDKAFWLGFKAQFDSDFTREFFYKLGDKFFGSWFWTPPLCLMAFAGILLQKMRARMENFKLKTVFAFLFPAKAREYDEIAQLDPDKDPWHDALFDVERTMDVENGLRFFLCGKVAEMCNYPVDIDPEQGEMFN